MPIWANRIQQQSAVFFKQIDSKVNQNLEPEAIWPGLEEGVPKPIMPYSPAVKAGGWVFIAGQLASDFKTGLPPEVRPKKSDSETGLELQTRFIFSNIAKTIEATGCDLRTDTVKIWEWYVSSHPNDSDLVEGHNFHGIDIEPYIKAREEFFNKPSPPRSGSGISELMWQDTELELEVICFNDDNESVTFDLPADIEAPNGGQAAALRRGDWVFLGNESSADRRGENLSLEQQANYVLEKLSKTAEIAGSSLQQTVKAEVFIGNPNDFERIDQVWRQWFPDSPPARVVVPRVGMETKGNRIEVALTLLANDAILTKSTIETSEAPMPLGHEPQAVKVGNFLFLSTQMAFDSHGKIADGMVRNPAAPWYGSPGKAQMRYMMHNINAICETAGTSVENIVRRACFHSHLQWFAESIEEWASYFPTDKPASTTIGLNNSLVVDGANTLLDLIAYVPDSA